MGEVLVLLQGPHEAGHRCHLFLNPNTKHDYRPFRLRTIKKTWAIHNSFLAHLDAYGLQGFARITSSEDPSQLRSDPSLLTSLVDRWRPETHTFHFRFGELASTLKDVSMITALPIRGEPLVSPRVSPSWPLDIAARLGMEMPESQRTGGPRGIPLVWLHDNFLLPGLIYIAENMVDEPLPEHPKYSFGSAMLSHTYRGLCDATQKTSFTQKAPLICVAYEFLQLWSWEYLPVGRPRIVQPAHPYDFSEGGSATMATRWTKARKCWSPDIAKNCYPMYHQQFEILDEAEVTWNPWTQDQLQMVFDARPFTLGMLSDSAFWLTRCNLLFLWYVEPYNPERVMRQFGLYQEIPPPFPRRIDEETHK
ncbi:hypothetical protein VPH35_073377 [Triticum aestivum]